MIFKASEFLSTAFFELNFYHTRDYPIFYLNRSLAFFAQSLKIDSSKEENRPNEANSVTAKSNHHQHIIF